MKKKFLITGANGQLGKVFLDLLGNEADGIDLPDVDITEIESVKRAIDRTDPEWIINCSAVTDVDLCQRRPELAFEVHRDGVGNLARTGRKLVTFSTDHVFNGRYDRVQPFLEGDTPYPANIYGESKLQGESEALGGSVDNIVIRTSWLFSESMGMVPYFWRMLSENAMITAVTDQVACLTYAPDLAGAVLKIIIDGRSGLFHLASSPGVTPFELATMLAEYVNGTIQETTWAQLDLDAPRPAYSVLATSRDLELPTVWDAVEKWRISK
ncbi:MAG: NAD(P)-dependent oxidoreductase [Candidatus Aegiribacteria sp.]|nr:NAD(P)-dependent oxidoreductase [Candidatus Aegiribacteria sp.]